ncbi:MAG: hypothetical protein ACXABK_03685, partial [Candidatus Heimdallarchaeaceae archaeon]
MIKHLLILTTYGQIFYSQEFEKTEETEAVDVALTGGLMSAIYSMATETQREKISEFEMVTSRVVFQEDKSDLLFVLTVDKRMDVKDTYELLEMISKRFFEKYGEIRIDGLVLTDFEADATEIIYKKLWFLETQERKFRIWDYLATILVTLAFSWYILLVFGSAPFAGMPELGIKTFVWDELLANLGNPVGFVLHLVLLIAVIAIPTILIYLMFKFTYVKDIFRFTRDYLSRPTRASYAELLPNYFLMSLVVSFLLYFSLMIFAGGFFTELRAFPVYPGGLIPDYNQPFDFRHLRETINVSDIGDQMVIGAITWVTWIFVFPFLYSVMLGQRNWGKIYRNAVFIASLAILILMLGNIFGGVKYQEAVGFHPQEVIFASEQNTLLYNLIVTIP